MTRDPRVYPQKGDVLRSPNRFLPAEEYVTETVISDVTNEWVLFAHGAGVPIGCWEQWCRVQQWEVVKVANG